MVAFGWAWDWPALALSSLATTLFLTVTWIRQSSMVSGSVSKDGSSAAGVCAGRACCAAPCSPPPSLGGWVIPVSPGRNSDDPGTVVMTSRCGITSAGRISTASSLASRFDR